MFASPSVCPYSAVLWVLPTKAGDRAGDGDRVEDGDRVGDGDRSVRYISERRIGCETPALV